ncbi:outer membrane protein assembly factor BamD [Sorangium sp. So ce1335]|uniref:outer membrane protein assembly factor BamD n=1 Tax=Sorangium sp. So ce1335 TaxID=3133335 RepID=UPI003F5E266A
MRPSAAVLAGCLAALGGLVGCDFEFNDGRTATLTYTEDARAAYNEAMAAFQAKDWEDARALFTELKRRFAYSRYARLADLRIADLDFEQGKYPEAIAAYRAFIQEHRTDRNIEYAKYRMAKALFLDIDDTVFLPPAEERDQATTIEAHREIRTFLRQFPRSRYREDAAYMLEVVTGRLVRHELYVARYYLKEDAFEAALARIDYALKTFPGSGLDPEALVLKGETLLKMKKRDEARAVFESVIRDWGGPFAVTARRFLDEMGPGRAPAKAASAPARSRPRL